MKPEERQRLVDQRARNAQTLNYVADEEANIASQADALVEESPDKYGGLRVVAALVREHRHTLMEIARAEQRLAADIQFRGELPERMAAQEREHRTDLLEIARAEGRLARELKEEGGEKDPTIAVLAEQAARNRELLLQVAETETEANRALWKEYVTETGEGDDRSDS